MYIQLPGTSPTVGSGGDADDFRDDGLVGADCVTEDSGNSVVAVPLDGLDCDMTRDVDIQYSPDEQ